MRRWGGDPKGGGVDTKGATSRGSKRGDGDAKKDLGVPLSALLSSNLLRCIHRIKWWNILK